MVEILHRRNRYVVVTGDGVNDSPNFKHPDIGIAMASGSNVAKRSFDIILSNHSFPSILNAIEEGYRIFDNIQNFVLHVLAANIGFVISLLAGLAFKDNTAISVFLSTPVEIIRMLPGTGAFSESAPLRHLHSRVYARYGRLRAGPVLGSFTTVIFGFGDGSLGLSCNNACSPSCHDVFRALATAYTAMMWIFVLFSGKQIDFRRSFFDMHKEVRAWGEHHLWGNWFLLFAMTVVFFMIFPVLYIPRLNAIVFMHTGIDREWGFVFAVAIAFVVGAEAWKRTKRIYLRRSQGPTSTN
ncbi:hypothetical protein V8C43DRAFT_325922 [Trichoderma afarasin]